METSRYSDVQALLKEMLGRRAPQKGKLRWSLQKKLDSSPSSSTFLLRLLLKELDSCFVATQQQTTSEGRGDQVFQREPLAQLIPLLHTLRDVIVQWSAAVPPELYQALRRRLTQLIILPPPFSSVAAATLRSVQAEMIAPGCSYHSRVASEQHLRSERERVVVLVDPAVSSAGLQAAVREHLQGASASWESGAVRRRALLHVLQAGLGAACHPARVDRALQVLGEQRTEEYFQRLDEAVEAGVGGAAGGRAGYLRTLQDLHDHIVTTAAAAAEHGCSGAAAAAAVPDGSMPFPEVHFVTWHNDDDLWDLLLDFSLHCGPEGAAGGCEGGRAEAEAPLQDGGESAPLRPPRLQAFARRKAFKNMKAAHKATLLRDKMEAADGGCALPRDHRGRHTARVVVVGDDGTLGRLARAYRCIRERESKHLLLTKRLNLRLYYVPLADLGPTGPHPPAGPLSDPGPAHHGSRFSLSSFLGRVDPWYHSNVNGLHSSVTKLYEMHCKNLQPSRHNLFLLDSLCYYLRCGWQSVKLPIYSVKMSRCSSGGSSVVQETFVSRLEADIPEFQHLKEKSTEMQFAVRRKKAFGHGASLSVSYVKTSLSQRQEVRGSALLACGLVVTSEPAAATSGENLLRVRFDCVDPECNTEIRTRGLILKTVAGRTLCVRLDQDSRRTFKDIQRLEISRCPDPGNQTCSSFRSLSEPVLIRSLDGELSLPISTFSSLPP